MYGSTSLVSHFPRSQTPQCNGRIEVPSGNMTARKNHHHERGTYRQRGKRTGAAADDRAPNGQNQEEGPDEFSEVLVHDLSPSTLDCDIFS
jgi:hypothetical protein